MAHPSRKRAAMKLAVSLGGRVVYDPSPGGLPSAWRCAREAWLRSAAPGTTHVLVCQDDCLPGPHFLARLAVAVERRPRAMVAAYVGSIHAVHRAYMQHQRVGAADVPLPRNHFVPTVALVMPVGMISPAIDYLDAKLPRGWQYDDEAFKLYRQADRSVEAYATIPCLVSHDNGPRSVMRHGHHGKRYPMA